jgi:hypothetical protein
VLLVLRIALPFVLAWAVPRLAADFGLAARIGDVDLGLIAGEVTLEDVWVDLAAEADAPMPASGAGTLPPLLQLDRIHVAFEWTGLLVSRIHLTAFELDAPTIGIVQLADGRLRLPVPPTDGAAEGADDETEEADDAVAEAETEPSSWTFVLDRFELNRPEILLRAEGREAEVVRLAARQLEFDALVVAGDEIGVGGIDVAEPALFVERKWALAQGDTRRSREDEPEPADMADATHAHGAEDMSDTTQAPEPADVADATQAPESAEVPEPTSLPTVEIEHVKIDRADFSVRTESGLVEAALRLDVTDAGTRRDQTFPIELGLEIGDATIELAGRLGLAPPTFEGELHWKKLKLPPFLQLAAPELVPWVASCDAEGDVEIEFHSAADDAPPGARVQGRVRVADLQLRQPETEELALGWDALEIELREITVPLEPTAEHPVRVALGRVDLESPTAVYTQPPDALDALLAAAGGGGEKAGEGAEGAEGAAARSDAPSPTGDEIGPVVTVEEVEVSGGSLRYVDRTVQPRHRTRIEGLHVVLDGVANTPAPGAEKVLVEGAIQSTGHFRLAGALPNGRGELDFELEELDLATYDSLVRSAGWRIEQGRGSLDSEIATTASGYETRNHLVLHDLRVDTLEGNDFASTFGMSLDVALALLRDVSGDIAISAPVVIDTKGTGVDLVPVLQSALQTALKGVLSSPFKMLGAVIPRGGGEAELAIAFAPGDEALPSDADERLRALSEFVEDRPALGLTLVGHWTAEDREPTARRMLREAAVAGDELPELEGVGFFVERRIAGALRERAEGGEGRLEPADEAILERYVTAMEVPEERLRELAGARAEAIRSGLLERGTPVEAVALGKPSGSDEAAVSIELGSRGG